MKAIFKGAHPYADDKMNLPVASVDAAIPFYESVMGFRVVSRTDSPHKSAILGRDEIQIEARPRLTTGLTVVHSVVSKYSSVEVG